MRAQSLEQAIRGSDLYAKGNVVKGPMLQGFVVVVLSSPLILKTGFARLMRRARWRRQPATESQKTFVESRWHKAPKYVQGETGHDAAHNIRIQRMTKGQAANIITRIKHGAMVFTSPDGSQGGGLTDTP